MLATFLVIGFVGLGIALLALIVGDVFDLALDFVPDGALSTTSVAGTLGGFGFFGAASIGLLDDPATWLTLLIACIGAVLGWVLTWGIVAATRSQEQPSGSASLDTLVGHEAVVVEAPRAPGMAGTVSTSFLGSQRRLHFRAADAFHEGDRVVIDSVLSTTQVTVSRLTH